MARKRKADPEKIKKILEKRGYKDEEPSPSYEVHHVKPLAEGGKDTPKILWLLKRVSIAGFIKTAE
jgi:hypothetical protein